MATERAESFITETLERFEGAGRRKGYVPMYRGEVIGNSGVTIGTGVDLGQHTQEALQSMGVPATLVGVLVPYLGLKRSAAVAKLRQLPLELSAEAVVALDKAVIGHFIQTTELRFNKAVQKVNARAGKELLFAARPKEVQAVAVSLAYQLGFTGFPRCCFCGFVPAVQTGQQRCGLFWQWWKCPPRCCCGKGPYPLRPLWEKIAN